MGTTIELIPDGAAFLRWLELAGLLAAQRRELRTRFDHADLDLVAYSAVDLREWVRPVIAGWAEGRRATPGARHLDRLNALLAADSRHGALARDGSRLALTERPTWATPEALLALPALATAELLAYADPALIRNCEGVSCPLWFYDRTKGHHRRWCTMAICGNRAKARTYRAGRVRDLPASLTRQHEQLDADSTKAH